MKYRSRKVSHQDGSVEIKVSVIFTAEEIEAAEGKSDIPDLNLGMVTRASSVDESLGWLRVYCYWAEMWNNRERFKSFWLDTYQRRKWAISKLTSIRKKSRRRK